MNIELKYGETSAVRLDLPAEKLVWDGSAPPNLPLVEPTSATLAAIRAPLNYPPLSQAILSGDRVAVAVGEHVPQMPSVVGALLRAMIEDGMTAEDIGVVLPPTAAGGVIRSLKAAIPAGMRDSLHVATHDPHDSGSLCYLAASKDGKPIYFNRTLFDADLVISVGALRLEKSLGFNGIYSDLFPGFSDEATQARFRVPAASDWPLRGRRQREATEEAAWLLGTQFTVQATPGPGAGVLQVLAGEARTVASAGRPLCETAWQHQVMQRAQIVVAGIDGGSDQQNWESFARALYAASNGVLDGGTVVLCTSLRGSIGPALKQLSQYEGHDEAMQKAIRRERSPDAVSASLLAQVLRSTKVFLLSELDGDEVEELGVGHIERADDVQRLCLQHDTCIVIGNAQHAMVSLPDE